MHRARLAQRLGKRFRQMQPAALRELVRNALYGFRVLGFAHLERRVRGFDGCYEFVRVVARRGRRALPSAREDMRPPGKRFRQRPVGRYVLDASSRRKKLFLKVALVVSKHQYPWVKNADAPCAKSSGVQRQIGVDAGLKIKYTMPRWILRGSLG